MAKLGDTKKKIMRALSEKSKTMTDLSNELQLSQSTVSEHIQGLLNIGAIIEADESNKKWKYYKINPEYIQNELDFKRKFEYILIGVVIAAVVASLLIYLSFSGQSRLSCTGASGYSCSNITRTSSGQLSVQIGGFVSPTHILGVGCSYNSSEPGAYNPLNISLYAGQYAPINVTCPSVLPPQTRILGIWIRSSSNGLTTTEHVANITIGTTPTTSIVPTTSAATTIPTTVQTTATTTMAASSTTIVQSTNSTTTMPTSTTSVSTTTIIQGTGTGTYSSCNSEWVTIYVGQNTICGSFVVSLLNLGSSTVNGQLPAIINTTDLSTGQSTGQQTLTAGGYFIAFNTLSGHNLFIHLNNTFSGLYTYQRYAYMYLSSIFPLQPIVTLNSTWVSYPNTNGLFEITMQASAHGGNAPYIYHFMAINSTLTPFWSNIYNSSPTTATNYTYSFYANSITSIQLLSGKSYYGKVYVTDEYGLANYSNNEPFTIPSGCNTTVTLYVGYNDTCSPFTIQFADLGQPNANGISSAGIDVYYNGILTNVTQVYPGTIQKFTYSGHLLYIFVNKTFAGLYAYQRYAQILLTTSIAPSSCGPTQIVYVGQNATCSYYTVQLLDLGQPNATGSVPALFNVYYAGGLTNTSPSLIYPGQLKTFIATPSYVSSISIYVNQTFAGLYAYQRWAKISMNVQNYMPGGCGMPTTSYVDQIDIYCAPFTAMLTNLGQPNASGVSPADVNIYYNGILTNSTVVMPGHSYTATTHNYTATLSVNSTFAGLYSSQRWAVMSLTANRIYSSNYPSVSACNKFEKITINNNVTCYPFSVKIPAPNTTDVYLQSVLTNVSTIKPGQSQTFNISLPYMGSYTTLAYTLKVSMNKTYNWTQGWGDILLNVTDDRPVKCNALIGVYFILPNNTCQSFTVRFAGFGAANANGIFPAQFDIYYSNVLTNATSSIFPSQAPYTFDVSGKILKLTLNSTFDTWSPPQDNGAIIKMNVT